jgi:hypothetical protein
MVVAMVRAGYPPPSNLDLTSPSGQPSTLKPAKPYLTLMAALANVFGMSLGEGNQANDPAAAGWASDRNRLFPGEVSETVFLEDAQHWVRVYRDLVSFTSAAMDGLTRSLISGPSQDGHDHPDLLLLRGHLDRLRWRLQIWEARARELAAS